MKYPILSPLLGAAMFAAVVLGCEPGSVTEAREQLGRGSNDTITYVIPLTNDTFMVSEFLDSGDTVTTPDGLLSLRVQDEDVAFDFTDVLQTDEVSTTTALPSPGWSAPGDPIDTLRFTTPAGSNVVGATASSGWAVRTTTNSTSCDATVNISVADSIGNTVAAYAPNLFVGSGNTVTDSVSLNGASFNDFVVVAPAADFGACTPGGGQQVSMDLTFRPMVLASVDLDNLSESFAVEEAEELIRSDLEFDELEDAIDQSTLNSATLDMTVVNGADIPVVLDNLTIGAVRLDGAGQLVRDGGGNLVYEADGGGTPILINVAPQGQTTLSVPRNGMASVSVPAAELVDRITHILLADERVAFVAAGTAESSDGSSGRILLGSIVDIQYTVTVGLDFTIPLTGVEFTSDNTVSGGVGLDTLEIDDVVDRLVSVSGEARVENFTAFGVEVTAGVAPGALAPTDDVFAAPGAFTLPTTTVGAPTVDVNGIPQGSVSDSVAVSITPQEARQLLGDSLTTAVRVRMLPGAGGGGRGVIRPDDGIALTAVVTVRVQRGGQ